MVSIALHEEQPIPAQAVRQLYDAVGWWPERTLAEITDVLNREQAVGAWAAEELVGFARVVSDGHWHAYIEDVMVHPDYRRHGIADRMLQRLLETLSHTDTISLFCHSSLIPLYERHGFALFEKQKILHYAKY
ncbi:MAG: GNAT family N-acetyltransferase [Caldilineaceae bacterium]|nr:GNAT family N-acetyltransferase [Caldilineaceae bacterium]